MARSRSRTADLASYLALKAIAGSLLAMPMEWAVGLIRFQTVGHFGEQANRRLCRSVRVDDFDLVNNRSADVY